MSRYDIVTNLSLSEKQIARALKVSRTAISKHVSPFLEKGLSYEQIEDMADRRLIAIMECLL